MMPGFAAAIFCDVRPYNRPVDRGHDQHGKWPASKPRLVGHILITRKEYLKALRFDQREQYPFLMPPQPMLTTV
jgi:hypothetical protein